MNREVWSAEEAFVSIWNVDGSGNPTTLLYEACFAQELSAAPIRIGLNNRQSGVGYEEPRSRVIGHTIRIGTLYLRAATQITPFLGTSKYRILVEFINPRYPDVAPLENDTHDYRGCVAQDGPEWSVQDGQLALVRTTFQAERKI